MFRLHETTRRRVCLWAFVLLCPLPVVAVAGWCLWRHVPAHVAAHVEQLEQQLGLDVSLGGLEHLRPGTVLYRDLALSDPESGRVVLRCAKLEAGWVDLAGSDQASRRGLMLIATDTEIAAEQIGSLDELLDRLMARRLGPKDFSLRITAGSLTLADPQQPQTLVDLTAGIESTPQSSRAQLRFRLAGDKTPEPIRLNLARDRAANLPTTNIQLDTAGTAVPCRLLAHWLPALDLLGPQCRLRGYLWGSPASVGTTGNSAAADPAPVSFDTEMTGELLGVDLGRLLTEYSPHSAAGTVNVALQSARFHAGRLVEAAGTISGGPGTMGRSLLDAAVAHLQWRTAAFEATQRQIAYEQLALAFVLSAGGWSLRAVAPAWGPGIVLAHGRQPLLGDPLTQPQPILGLVRLLAAPSLHQVPATSQSQWLLRHLPEATPVVAAGIEPSAEDAAVRLGRRDQP